MNVPSRVLLLDGDAALSETIADAATVVGMDARVESSFSRFSDAIDAWRPTHLVVDLTLSEFDGIEVVRHLADRGYRGAVIITSHLDARVLDAARRSGAAHGLSVTSLARPLQPQRLAAVLTETNGVPRGDALGEPAAQPDVPPITRETLSRAIDEREFRVVYQPKLDCRTGALVAFEGLARWHDVRRGAIPPTVFVQLAESSGLIGRLTDLVFGEALGWFGAHFAGSAIVLCLNVSARSLNDVGFADRVEELCREASLDPSQLAIEVTETSSVPDQAMAHDVLTRFRMKGVAVALDDLGSGHSSLVQLARQPFSEFKIDRSFVEQAAESADARTIIRAIVGLGRGLGMRVTAEGVEDAAGLAAITELGCDVVQGNFIAPPMESEDALEWIDARDPSLRKEPREAQ